MTGDAQLRKVAVEMGIEVHSTIWIIDELNEQQVAEPHELLQVCKDLFGKVHERVLRLPTSELQVRINRFRSLV